MISEHALIRIPLKCLPDCRLEPYMANVKPGERYQLERMGYFCVDTKDTTEDKLVLNRTVTLRDQWVKIQNKGE